MVHWISSLETDWFMRHKFCQKSSVTDDPCLNVLLKIPTLHNDDPCYNVLDPNSSHDPCF
jgi:hypothetical protein